MASKAPQITEIFTLVETEMQAVDAKMRQVADENNKSLMAVIDYLVDNGGKQLRPKISLMASHFGTPDPEKAAALAAAIEMLHTATLVHDDLIDNALFRRGHPTLNTSWTPAATVLTGDYMFARSAELAAETENVRIIKIFSATLMTIVSGELQQLSNSDSTEPPDKDDYLQRIYAKTASLFAAAAQTAAILAALPENQVQALYDYGYHLGMAFQIVDDILDFEADADTLGKPVAHDLRQGIATLPVLYFLENTPRHPTILKAVAKKHPSDAEIEQVVSEIRASGSIQKAAQTAREYISQAQADLLSLPKNEYRHALHEVANYAVAREF